MRALAALGQFKCGFFESEISPLAVKVEREPPQTWAGGHESPNSDVGFSPPLKASESRT